MKELGYIVVIWSIVIPLILLISLVQSGISLGGGSGVSLPISSNNVKLRADIVIYKSIISNPLTTYINIEKVSIYKDNSLFNVVSYTIPFTSHNYQVELIAYDENGNIKYVGDLLTSLSNGERKQVSFKLSLQEGTYKFDIKVIDADNGDLLAEKSITYEVVK